MPRQKATPEEAAERKRLREEMKLMAGPSEGIADLGPISDAIRRLGAERRGKK